jgi:hypothetical protein
MVHRESLPIANAFVDGTKRKAEEEPSSPSAAKRIKQDDAEDSPEEKKPALKPIPFPEKVCSARPAISPPCGKNLVSLVADSSPPTCSQP